jgi:large repetitive protein
MRVVLLSICFFFIAYNANSQCTGSLGDPVVKTDFGSGAANPGAALSGITNYGYVTASCPSDGYYTIRNSTSGCFSSWHTLVEDHTAGDANGYMMIVNAANTAGEFYKQTITGLCPGTGYEISAYVLNLLRSTACTSNPNRFPKLTFRVETPTGTVLGTYDTPAIPTITGTANVTPAQWSRQALFFTSTSSSVVLKIINNAPGGCGNDLALDDIEFRPCGPTLTTAGGTTICVGQNVNLSSSLSAGYTNPVYQWQVSTDNVSFTDIAGQTTNTLSQSPTVGTKYYRLLASESGNIGNTKCRVASNVQTVTVNAIPAAPTASGVEYCQNASATALVASGAGTLNWYGTNAVGGSATSSQTPTTSSVGTLNYYVSSTVNGCVSPRTAVPVTINPLPVITATVGTLPCNGGTGTIVSSSSGGTPSYTFSKDGVNFQTTNILAGITAGAYTLTVKDSKNCIGTTTLTVPAGPVISLSAAVENECLAGNNGKVTLTASGTTGALTYNIDGGVYGASNIFTTVSAGSHTVRVSDAGTGCIVESTVVVPTITNPTVTITASTCVVGSTGVIVATAAAGTPTYQYALNGGSYQSGNTFTGQTAGAYTVTVKDSRGCTSVSPSETINAKPSPPTVPAAASYCFGATAAALAPTGTSLLWYTAPVGGSGSATTPSVNTSVAGIQNFYVSQTVSGCESDRAVITANVSPALSLGLSKIDACNNINNGIITATATGGTSPLTYAFNGGGAGATNVFENLAAASYPVVVADANGCTANASIAVGTGPVLSVTATTGGNCIDPAMGTISPTGTGGTGALQYKLNSGDYSTAIPFTALNPGTYDVFVKDAQGCIAQTTATIGGKPVAFPGSNGPSCQVGAANVIALEALEVTGATYAWTGPNGFTSTDQNPTIVYTTPASQQGTYTLTVTLAGCSSSSTVDVQCPLNPLPVRLISFGGSQFENEIIVNWEASEILNFNKFELEKSSDARSFEKIQEIVSPKNSQSKLQFNYHDIEPKTGVNYYRLKMIDLNGSFDYSKIIAVNFIKDGEYMIAKNPIEEGEISILTNIDEPRFKLFTILGQEIPVSIQKNRGGYSLKGDFTNQKMYILKIEGHQIIKSIRLITK